MKLVIYENLGQNWAWIVCSVLTGPYTSSLLAIWYGELWLSLSLFTTYHAFLLSSSKTSWLFLQTVCKLINLPLGWVSWAPRTTYSAPQFQLRTIFIIGKVNGSKFLIDTNERLKRSAKGHSKKYPAGERHWSAAQHFKFKFNCKLKFSSSAIHRVLFQQIIGICFLYGVLHSLSFVTVSLNWSICVFIAKLTTSIIS